MKDVFERCVYLVICFNTQLYSSLDQVGTTKIVSGPLNDSHIERIINNK